MTVLLVLCMFRVIKINCLCRNYATPFTSLVKRETFLAALFLW